MGAVHASQLALTFTEAAALLCMGIQAEPESYVVERTGQAWQSWHLRDDAAAAAAPVLQALRQDPAGPLQPGQPAPLPADHPLRAAVYALETHERLAAWLADPAAVPVFQQTSGPFCRLTKPGRVVMPPDAFPAAPAFGVPDLCHAAALIVCGFVPHPQLWERPGKPVSVGFGASSVTFPELTARMAYDGFLSAARPDGSTMASEMTVAPFAAGMHPLCWALQALAHAGAARGFLRQSAEDPSVIWKGRGTRSALVSLSLTEEKCKDSSIRDALPGHLNGY